MKKNLKGLITKSIFSCTIVLFFIPFIGKTQSSCQTAVTSRLDSLTQLTINDTVFWLKFTASRQNLDVIIIDTNTLQPANFNTITLYGGNCNQLIEKNKTSNGRLFSNSIVIGNDYYLKLNRSIINIGYFSILLNTLDSTFYNYSWSDSTDCMPYPAGCECIPNNDFSIVASTNFPQLLTNEIWGGIVCGWHALRATPGLYQNTAQLFLRDAMWTNLKNVQPNTEYCLNILYNNFNTFTGDHLYYYLTNREL